jgi:hypothetical protein
MSIIGKKIIVAIQKRPASTRETGPLRKKDIQAERDEEGRSDDFTGTR